MYVWRKLQNQEQEEILQPGDDDSLYVDCIVYSLRKPSNPLIHSLPLSRHSKERKQEDRERPQPPKLPGPSIGLDASQDQDPRTHNNPKRQR